MYFEGLPWDRTLRGYVKGEILLFLYTPAFPLREGSVLEVPILVGSPNYVWEHLWVHAFEWLSLWEHTLSYKNLSYNINIFLRGVDKNYVYL
jgi:hypothetical protein